MMGVYLLSIASHDALYRDLYNRFAFDWMDSWSCQMTGVLAVLSGEVSVLILATVSIDCCLAVSRPYRGDPLTAGRAVVVLGLVWTAGFILAGLPVVHDRQFYGSNGVCAPLHIHDPFAVGWQYSAVIYLGVNTSAVFLIGQNFTEMAK